MNIVFVSMDDSDNYGLQSVVTEKLLDLCGRYPIVTCAQVNLRRQDDKTGADRVCEINITHCGEQVSVNKRAGNYELAAYEAIGELTRKLDRIPAARV